MNEIRTQGDSKLSPPSPHQLGVLSALKLKGTYLGTYSGTEGVCTYLCTSVS